ncbi:unnamed protein product [Fraxinus pennsylvanica]|uniref:Uncharacterized protein n=1 Tax=Fraxinus pennsylvanica TaxID=56036 RepID=A0AAD2E5U5_9LAMI|nr:unnamed protein product [Fraxinus pennsylvanica]
MEPGPVTVINLFDSMWFYSQILKKQSNSSSSPNPDRHNQENSRKPKISSQLTIHTRSKSDRPRTCLRRRREAADLGTNYRRVRDSTRPPPFLPKSRFITIP